MKIAIVDVKHKGFIEDYVCEILKRNVEFTEKLFGIERCLIEADITVEEYEWLIILSDELFEKYTNMLRKDYE